MKKVAFSAVLISASMLLAGCASQPVDYSPPMVKTTVDIHSAPAFLATPQTSADKLGSTVKGIDGSSTRYQGTVHGTKIYLGARAGHTVQLIFSNAHGKGFGSGNSQGNTVLSAELADGTWIEYVPQGATITTLEGFVPLSKYIIVEKH